MTTPSPPQDLQHLPLDAIEPNLHQPRRHFDEETLQELAGSIRERGVLQPVLVRPINQDKHQFIGGGKNTYQLIAGERRWRAAQLAGLQMIPALISEYDDLAALEIGLIENMAREDLNPVEEARACVTLVNELGLTYRQLGERVGRSEATMWNAVHLLDLSEEIIELLERGELSKTHGTALLVAKDPQVRLELAQKAIEHGWSVQTLKAHARESNNSPDHPAHSSALGHSSDSGHSPASPNHLAHSSAPAHSSDSAHSSASGHSPAPPVHPLHGDGSDDLAMNIARVWGDAVGVEVMVRTLPDRKLRVEFVFESPEGALAVGGQLAEKVARGSKRR
jgi:ParB family chromosome partitioning protein